jgi:drug/metabolite transporter (DMT)-like permease
MTPKYNNIPGSFIAFILALIGTISLVIIKKIDDKIISKKWIVISIIINIITIYITFIGLKYTSLTILNMQWNVISNIIVTIVGVLYFNEVHSTYEIIGLTLGFISIMILSLEHLV